MSTFLEGGGYMTLFDIQLQEAIETAKQKGHPYIVAFPVERNLDEILTLEPLARLDLIQHKASRITGNGYFAVFGKIEDFSKTYQRAFSKKCTELHKELQFESY